MPSKLLKFEIYFLGKPSVVCEMVDLKFSHHQHIPASLVRFQTPKPQSVSWLWFPYGLCREIVFIFFRQLSRCLLFKSHQCLGLSSCIMILRVCPAQLIIYRHKLNWLDHFETNKFSEELLKLFCVLVNIILMKTALIYCRTLTGLCDTYFCIVCLERKHASVLKSEKLWGFLWKNNKERLIKKTECSTWCP